MRIEDVIAPAVVLAVFALVFFVRARRGAELKELFQRVANMRNGRVKSGNFLFYPKLFIPHNDREILVRASDGGKNSPPYTFFITSISLLRDMSFKLSPEHALSNLGKGLGMQDIEIGNPEIDSSFVIKSNDETFIRNFLNDALQEQFIAAGKHGTTIALNANELRMSVPRRITEERVLEQFLTLQTAMLDRLKEMSAI